MKFIKRLRTIVIALLFSVTIIASGTAVYAQQGADDSSTETAKSGRSQARVAQAKQAETEHATEAKPDDNPHQLSAKGAAATAELRKEHKTQTADQRQKKCESHKQGLTNKFSHIVTNSQRIQTRIDGILSKAIAYKQANNLQPENFDALVAAAQTAKATSAASIANLQAVKPSLDCNSTSVADDVATFKTAAQQTRDNLKSYRTAVKAVLKSLEAVKPAASDGSAQ